MTARIVLNIITLCANITVLILLIASIIIRQRANKNKPESKQPMPLTDDIVSLKRVNAFIKREFMFELQKWIQSAPTEVSVGGINGRNTSFQNDIKDPDIIQARITAMVSLIIYKMSPGLIEEFYSVYNREPVSATSEDNLLYDYISRYVLFCIRRVDRDITELFVTNRDIQTIDLLKSYVVDIEETIDKMNDINIVELEEEEANGASTASS